MTGPTNKAEPGQATGPTNHLGHPSKLKIPVLKKHNKVFKANKGLDLERARERAIALKACQQKHHEYLRKKQLQEEEKADPKVRWTNIKYWREFHASVPLFFNTI